MGISRVDRFDLLALLGLGLLNVGLAAIYWPLAPLVTGIVILGAVVQMAARQKGATHGTGNDTGEAGA